MKKFTVAGVSTSNGVTKYRVANSTDRDKALTRAGHTNIKLIELPSAMTKDDAIKFIAGHKEFAGIEAKAPAEKKAAKPKTANIAGRKAAKAPAKARTAKVAAKAKKPVKKTAAKRK